jgi:hypothetical protein
MTGDCGHEQLISSGGRFKLAFAARDKKQTMFDLRGISRNWFKNQLCPSIRLSILWALGQNIQRRGSILTWIVILSVYGADIIAE